MERLGRSVNDVKPSVKTETRVRKSLLWTLIGCFLISVGAAVGLPESKAAKKAKVTITRDWAKQIADFLRRRAAESRELTGFDGQPVLQSAFIDSSAKPSCVNSRGEVVDYWKTPFQIRIVAQTNFIIRAAGPNRKFGDDDDIVFDSVSDGFAKP